MKPILFFAAVLLSLSSFASSEEIQAWAAEDQKIAVHPMHGTQWIPQEGSTKTMLIFHGLHESPYYMRNWAEFFHQRGYNILNVRLPGHFTRGPNGLKNVKAEEWIETANKAYQLASDISSEVAVLGYSTGGTLSAHLALQHPDKVKNIFLISPAFSLSNRVFLTTLLLNPTGISSSTLCKHTSSKICQALMASDPEYKMMVKNGLEISPQAGRQVQRLIELVFNVNTRLGDYYGQISIMLDKISATIAMANTRADIVVNEKFNQEWIEEFRGKKFSLMFNKEDKIYHGLMNKNPETRFKYTDRGYNIRYLEVETLFDQAL